MNIFDLPGPEFLRFFAIAFFIALGLSFLFPHLLRFPFSTPIHFPPDLNPYQIAYLKGGKIAALKAAIASLWQRGILSLGSFSLQRVFIPLPADLHPLESSLLEQMGSTFRISHLQSLSTGSTASRLYDQGLLLLPFHREFLRLLRTLPLVALLAIALIKIGVGIWREKPVLYLFLWSILLCFLTVLAFMNIPRRTWRGDRALRALAHKNSALEFSARRKRQDMSPQDAALTAALFGVSAAFFGTQFARALDPPKTQPPWLTGNDSGGSSGSCSSGGGGCGGGGGEGGGAGCGGCGGGGH
jgi:uncharacterized protein (TIGR04222 family)